MSADPARRPDAQRRAWLHAGLAFAALGPGAAFGRDAAGPAVAEPSSRSALVIGAADYPTGRLANPVNDARLMASTLREIGFTVAQHENPRRADMLEAMRRWLVASSDAGVRVFYFAGHGIESAGRNYVLPVDARIDRPDAIRQQAVNVSGFVERLSQYDTGVNLVILDACRNLPRTLLAQRERSRSGPLSEDGGLGPLPAPRGTLVAFATAPGAVAADGIGARHSVYTRELARLLKVPGLTVEQLFKRVREFVMRATDDAQRPWESSSLVGELCLRTPASGRCGAIDVIPGRGPVVDMRRL